MCKKEQRLLSVLACAGSLTMVAGLATQTSPISKSVTVKAATDSVAARSYGVDVASYQSSDVTADAQAGAQFAIVKVSEGTSYQNPKASAQVASAINNNMMPMAYHFATFGADSASAVAEANFVVASAQAVGLPSGSYIACDWESGQGNTINAGKTASANAILAFMNQISASGYKPLLYSGAYLLRNNIDTSVILNSYPNSLWVASYATLGRIDTPDFNYFPSMDGIAIWQFTDNWRGLSVDGNITLLPLSYNSSTTQAPVTNTQQVAEQAKPENNTVTTNSSTEVKTVKTVMHKAYIYDKDGNRVGNSSIGAYNQVTVLGGMVVINGKQYYKIGDNQYVNLSNIDGRKRVLTHNAYVYNNQGQRVYAEGKLYAGRTLYTYGSSMSINGKRYFRINRNRYVKTGNF